MTAIMAAIEAASPRPRAVSPGSNQLKQRLGLLAATCSGARTAKPSRSARAIQPALTA
jgi:hypothetical protein